MDIGVALITWGTFASYPIPDKFRLLLGSVPRGGMILPENIVKVLLNLTIIPCLSPSTQWTHKKRGTASPGKGNPLMIIMRR